MLIGLFVVIVAQILVTLNLYTLFKSEVAAVIRELRQMEDRLKGELTLQNENFDRNAGRCVQGFFAWSLYCQRHSRVRWQTILSRSTRD
jgi:hypothetical protein